MSLETITADPIEQFTKETTTNLGIEPENAKGFLTYLNSWLSKRISPDLLQELPKLTAQYNERVSTLIHQIGEEGNVNNLLELKSLISEALSNPDPNKTELNRVAILLSLFQQIFTNADDPNSNYLNNLKRLVVTLNPRELAKIKIYDVNKTGVDLIELYSALYKSHGLTAEPRQITSQEKKALELMFLDLNQTQPFPLPTSAGTPIRTTYIPW